MALKVLVHNNNDIALFETRTLQCIIITYYTYYYSLYNDLRIYYYEWTKATYFCIHVDWMRRITTTCCSCADFKPLGYCKDDAIVKLWDLLFGSSTEVQIFSDYYYIINDVQVAINKIMMFHLSSITLLGTT